MSALSLKRKITSDEPVLDLAAQHESSPVPREFRIGDILMHEGLLTADQVELVLAQQKGHQPPLYRSVKFAWS